MSNLTDGGKAAENYSLLYEQFIRNYTAYRECTNSIANMEIEFHPELEDCTYASVFSDYADKQVRYNSFGKAPRKIAVAIVELLCQTAAREFAPHGCSAIGISAAQYCALFVPNEGFDPTAFKPLDVWAVLCKEFGGEAGVEQGYREAAKVLIDAFGLLYHREIKRRSNHVALNVSVGTEASFDGNGRRLCFHSHDTVNATLSALRVFGLWAGCCFFSSQRFDYRDSVLSREHYTLIDDDLECITYYSRFEFRFTPALAERLQVFIATYGALEHEVAA